MWFYCVLLNVFILKLQDAIQYMYILFFCRRCVFNLTMKIVCRTWSMCSAEMILIGLLGNCLFQLLMKANFSYHHVITRSCKQYNSCLGKFPIHPIFLQSYVRGICVLIKQVGLSLSGIEPISCSVSFEIPRSYNCTRVKDTSVNQKQNWFK